MDLLKIRQKEFCRLTNLTRKALFIYEERELLIPESIDSNNGYRYYGEEQIIRGSMLSFLKNFNFSLDEIESIINKQITIPELGLKKHTRQALIDTSIKVNNCLRALLISKFEKKILETEPFVKTYPQHTVITLESNGTISAMKMNIPIMEMYVKNNTLNVVGPMFVFYYKDCYPPCYHYKICIPIGTYNDVYHPDIKWEKLVNYKVAATRHIGSYENLFLTYKRLKITCKNNKWPCSGEYIETYVVGGDTRYTDSSSFITEVAAILS